MAIIHVYIYTGARQGQKDMGTMEGGTREEGARWRGSEGRETQGWGERERRKGTGESEVSAVEAKEAKM